MAYNSKFTGAQIDALLDSAETMQTSKEDVANKVTTLDADATDEQYPSAKAVKDAIHNIYHTLATDAEGIGALSFTDGRLINLNPPYSIVDNANGSCTEEYYAITEDDVYSIETCQYSGYPIAVIYDSNYTPIRTITGEGASSLVRKELIVRQGESYARFSKVKDIGFAIQKMYNFQESAKSIGAQKINLDNGSNGNAANPNVVKTRIYPFGSSERLYVETNRPNTEGCVYYFGHALYNKSYGYADNKSIYSDSYGGNLKFNDFVDKGSYNALGGAFIIAEYNPTTASYSPLRWTDFEGYYVRVYGDKDMLSGDLKKLSDFSADSIATLNNITNADARIISPTFVNGGAYNYSSPYQYVTHNEMAADETYYPVVEGELWYVEAAHFTNWPIVVIYDESKNPLRIIAGISSSKNLKKKITIGRGEAYIRLAKAKNSSFTIRHMGLNSVVEEISREVDKKLEENVFTRNKDRQRLLLNACRYHQDSNTSKDFQLMIITDSHGEVLSVSNAAFATKSFSTIDAVIHCGDITGSYYTPDAIATQLNELKKAGKPWFVVVGNHDVGNSNNVMVGANHEQIYGSAIKPVVDAGYMKAGEYQDGKCYYYHDFTDRKVRLIVLYEYDAPLELDETYYRAIPYDSSLPKMEYNRTYSTGTRLNVPVFGKEYTDHSFEVVQDVTTGANWYSGQWPKYKIARGLQFIRQEQAQWFLDTLASTPAEYGVVVAMHNPFSTLAKGQNDRKFNQPNYSALGEASGQYAMKTDFISDCVNAFMNKAFIEEKVAMKDDAYNLQEEGGVKYAYKVSKDFSNVTSKFYCFIGGHAHKDIVYRHTTHEGQWGINPLCATTESANNKNADIKRLYNKDGYGYDSLTVVSFADNRIACVKIGNDYTIDGIHRDVEVIKTNEE